MILHFFHPLIFKLFLILPSKAIIYLFIYLLIIVIQVQFSAFSPQPSPWFLNF